MMYVEIKRKYAHLILKESIIVRAVKKEQLYKM